VFVGGCATALLITDAAAADVRPTFDVDAIAEITSYAGYTEFSERLRKLGFQEDTREGAPLCRWRQQTTTLDVMPLDAKILGFSNSWYRPAMDHAEERELDQGLKIRLVTAVYFCASKIEAFAGRGKNDFPAGMKSKSCSRFESLTTLFLDMFRPMPPARKESAQLSRGLKRSPRYSLRSSHNNLSQIRVDHIEI